MLDIGVAQANGEVPASVSGGDHQPAAQALEGDVPQPGRVAAVRDAGVDADHDGHRGRVDEVQSFGPAGRVLGEEQPHPDALDREHLVTAGDVGHIAHGSHRRRDVDAEHIGGGGGHRRVGPVRPARELELESKPASVGRHHVVAVEREVGFGASEVAVGARPPAVCVPCDLLVALRTGKGVEPPPLSGADPRHLAGQPRCPHDQWVVGVGDHGR